jgi:hypothetical protein
MSDSSRYVPSTDAWMPATTPDPGPTSAPGAPGQPDGQPEASPDAPAAPVPATPSAADARFQSCRWRKPETPPYCSHPEVLPFAGMNGFKPESWCPGCAFYKLRRNPRRDY